MTWEGAPLRLWSGKGKHPPSPLWLFCHNLVVDPAASESQRTSGEVRVTEKVVLASVLHIMSCCEARCFNLQAVIISLQNNWNTSPRCVCVCVCVCAPLYQPIAIHNWGQVQACREVCLVLFQYNARCRFEHRPAPCSKGNHQGKGTRP